MLKKSYIIKFILILLLIVLCILFGISNIEITNSNISKSFLNSIPSKTISLVKKRVEKPMAHLTIKSLNIDRDIYKFNSSNNTVEKNVMILKQSTLPDKDQSIVFLASHSGSSKVSYFNNLEKIKKNDEIDFYYNNYQYTYKVVSYHIVDKDGDIEVSKRREKQLILTTCSTKHKNKQFIVDSILVKEKRIG